jgi:predicted ATP-grasp superfamily ATP-dependent carboligase
MNILVTGARFFPSIALIRAFHDSGLRVDVADALPIAPGLHSHAADKTHHIASPAQETLQFVSDVADIVRERDIDLVVPPFEDSFFLARFADSIPAPVFVPPFATLAQLHNKATFQDVCHRLGLRAPET